jgi:hypothetical protein
LAIILAAAAADATLFQKRNNFNRQQDLILDVKWDMAYDSLRGFSILSLKTKSFAFEMTTRSCQTVCFFQ